MLKRPNAVLEYIPLGGAIIIFVGISRLTFFYSFFNLNIFNYIQEFELIFSFLSFITAAFFTIFTVIVVEIFQIDSNKDHEQYLDMLNRSEKNHSFLRRLIQIYKWDRKVIRMFIFILIFFLVFFCALLKRFDPLLFLILFCFALVPVVLRREIIYYNQFKVIELNAKFYSSCLYFLLLMALLSYWDVVKIKDLKFNSKVNVYLDSTAIMSTKNYYYIGKTEGYIFFYNESTEVTDIYPIDRVIKIETNKKTVN